MREARCIYKPRVSVKLQRGRGGRSLTGEHGPDGTLGQGHRQRRSCHINAPGHSIVQSRKYFFLRYIDFSTEDKVEISNIMCFPRCYKCNVTGLETCCNVLLSWEKVSWGLLSL